MPQGDEPEPATLFLVPFVAISTAFCEICNKETRWVFGKETSPSGEHYYQQWTCLEKCGNTIAGDYHSIRKLIREEKPDEANTEKNREVAPKQDDPVSDK